MTAAHHMIFSLAPSAFPPLAVGFFGLGTGYLIFGARELFDYPKATDETARGINLSMGLWGIWMPGFMQFLAGVYLWVGLTWFGSFANNPALYMAALAFTAFGVHWFALGLQGAFKGDLRPNAAMCVAFAVISALGIVVFFHASTDPPVGGVFIGLVLVYISEFFSVVFGNVIARRALGFFRIGTACWLLYLMWAATLNFAIGYHWLL